MWNNGKQAVLVAAGQWSLPGKSGLIRKCELLGSEMICGNWLNADSCEAPGIFRVLGASVPEQHIRSFCNYWGKIGGICYLRCCYSEVGRWWSSRKLYKFHIVIAEMTGSAQIFQGNIMRLWKISVCGKLQNTKLSTTWKFFQLSMSVYCKEVVTISSRHFLTKKGNTTCNLWAVTHSLNKGCYFLRRPQAAHRQVFPASVGRWYSNSCWRRRDEEVFMSLLRCLLLKNWTEFPNIQWESICHPWDLSPALRGATARGSVSCYH